MLKILEYRTAKGTDFKIKELIFSSIYKYHDRLLVDRIGMQIRVKLMTHFHRGDQYAGFAFEEPEVRHLLTSRTER